MTLTEKKNQEKKSESGMRWDYGFIGTTYLRFFSSIFFPAASTKHRHISFSFSCRARRHLFFQRERELPTVCELHEITVSHCSNLFLFLYICTCSSSPSCILPHAFIHFYSFLLLNIEGEKREKSKHNIGNPMQSFRFVQQALEKVNIFSKKRRKKKGIKKNALFLFLCITHP